MAFVAYLVVLLELDQVDIYLVVIVVDIKMDLVMGSLDVVELLMYL